MSYVNVEELLERVKYQTVMSDSWNISCETVAVSDLEDGINELSQAPSQQPKTPTISNPKAPLHSDITKELNTTEEAVNDDKVNKPNHYVGVKGLEVEEVLQNFLPKYKDPYTSHRVGSAIEYQLRSPEKNGLEDLRKARKNLDQAIEYEESKVEKNGPHSFGTSGLSLGEMGWWY